MEKLNVLISGDGTPCFETKKHKQIRCAWDSKTLCSPICAALDERVIRLFCQRNGTENEFQIGWSDV